MLFALSIYAKINQSFWNQTYIDEYHLPTFLIAFAPWCHFCQETLPKWLEFAESFKNDTSIIIGEVNCSKEEYICREKLKITGFPTFSLIYKNKISELNLERSVQAFKREANKIILHSKNLLIHNFTGHFNNFPSFLFTLSPSNEHSIKMIKKTCFMIPYHVEPLFYFKFNSSFQDNVSIQVYLENNFSISLNESDSATSLRQFILEYANPLLGNWTYNSILPLKRLFALPFYQKIDDIPYNLHSKFNSLESFHQFALDTIDIWGWGNVENMKSFEYKFNLSYSTLPALVIIKPRSKEYAKIDNITEESLYAFADSFRKGNVSFHPFEKQNIDVIIHEFLKFFAKIFVLVIVILLLLACIGFGIYFYYNKIRHNDYEKLD